MAWFRVETPTDICPFLAQWNPRGVGQGQCVIGGRGCQFFDHERGAHFPRHTAAYQTVRYLRGDCASTLSPLRSVSMIEIVTSAS